MIIYTFDSQDKINCIESSYYSESRFSLKAVGSRVGINFINIGSNKLPPGNKNIVNEGIDLQIYNNCFLTFFFSLSSKSRVAETASKIINSLLCMISFTNRFLFRFINVTTFWVV